jgi:2-polyprenyl-3-methyl-5-hydroxy-6-metoxy-1,4-benzoquinol methylase
MSCRTQCHGIEQEFDGAMAEHQLRRYRRKGARKTTRILLDALCRRGVEDATLLDIGGGVGAIQHGLIEAGLQRAVGVDASRAYLEAARAEASRQGHADRLDLHFGDFVAVAPTIDPADIVTLDRVLCCYDDVRELVTLSAERARRLYGLVYPRVEWWTRSTIPLENLFFRAKGSDFRVYLHSKEAVEAILHRLGFTRVFCRETLVWQVVVYER